MLKKRIISAVLLIPLLFLFVWFDQPLPWLTIFVAVWGCLAALEFYHIVAAAKAPPIIPIGIIWTLLFIIGPHIIDKIGDRFLFVSMLGDPLLIGSLVIVSLAWLVLRRQRKGAFTSWVWTIAGVLYIGLLLSHMVALRGLYMGREWVLFTLFVTFASDSAAFFIGSAWGRRKLAPSISPRKTWEGAIGGAVVAMLLGPLLVWLFDLPIGYGEAIMLSLAVSVFGQLGDLIESLFKRKMKVKDSGSTIPGHGGFLDRMDSVVFASIVVYYYVTWCVGWFVQ